ncbi:MAG: hypothetical protein KAS32_10660 [Candidatus Peribacteraceae bacterium]|nr:hypothetical protein [Candidatus Peribacteraceae bacterium]
MKTTVTKSDFRDAFRKMGRDNFSYDGLGALFDYLEEYEESNDTITELDVIAFCCEFTEYENIAEFHENYDKEDYPDMTSINNATAVIKIHGTMFIIQDF